MSAAGLGSQTGWSNFFLLLPTSRLLRVTSKEAGQQVKVSGVKYWWGDRCDPKHLAGLWPLDRCVTRRGAASTAAAGRTTDPSTGESPLSPPSAPEGCFFFSWCNKTIPNIGLSRKTLVEMLQATLCAFLLPFSGACLYTRNIQSFTASTLVICGHIHKRYCVEACAISDA